MSMTIIEVTQKNIDDTLKTSGTVVLDFWANSCGPCKQLSTTLESIRDQQTDINHITVAKIRIDTEFALAKRFKVRSSPTLILFKNGEEIARKNNQWDNNSVLEFIRG